MTGQVRSLEEVAGNIRDMIVQPLQAVFDAKLRDGVGGRDGGGDASLRARVKHSRDARTNASPERNASAGGELPGAELDSNVHLYATLVLRDSLESKGFACSVSKHAQQKTVGTLATLGAPLHGFEVSKPRTTRPCLPTHSVSNAGGQRSGAFVDSGRLPRLARLYSGAHAVRLSHIMPA